jgi:transposase
MFQLSENRQLLWWNSEDEDKPSFEISLNKKKVMVWGGISRKGLTDLYYWKVDQGYTVNAKEYVKCLKETLIDKMDNLYGTSNWRLMQDNARVHTASYTKEFFIKNDIKVINHPPYSPDLNPIEKIWAYLKKKVMIKAYNNLDEGIDKVTDEWYKIPNEMIQNLIDCHLKRVQEVLQLDGLFL